MLALWLFSALCLALTLRAVWRGGTTLNDHLVAAVVTGCVGLYPTLGVLAAAAGLRSHAFLALLGLGPLCILGLFLALDLRRTPPLALTALARASQPAMAFALWAGLLLVLRSPVALLLGWPLWPGPWLLLPLALTVWGTAWTWLGRRTRSEFHRLAPLPGTPGPLPPAPLRIAQLSDIHYSPLMTGADVAALVAQVNALGVDLVVITGDQLMPFSEAEHSELVEELSRLAAPVYLCNGNHDLPVWERLQAELAARGMRTLVNEAATIQIGAWSLELVGVQFHWRSARELCERALKELPPAPAHARVLLAHDPRLFAWLPAHRFHLMLSGHTHGGQVGTDMFGLPGSVLRLLGVYDQGRFQRGATTLYVHRGNWHTGLPPRMGIAGEIVVHELRA